MCLDAWPRKLRVQSFLKHLDQPSNTSGTGPQVSFSPTAGSGLPRRGESHSEITRLQKWRVWNFEPKGQVAWGMGQAGVGGRGEPGVPAR